MDIYKARILFMNLVVDQNKDGVVCDADLFNSLKLT